MLVWVRIKELTFIKMSGTVLAWHKRVSSQILIPFFISYSLQFMVMFNLLEIMRMVAKKLIRKTVVKDSITQAAMCSLIGH